MSFFFWQTNPLPNSTLQPPLPNGRQWLLCTIAARRSRTFFPGPGTAGWRQAHDLELDTWVPSSGALKLVTQNLRKSQWFFRVGQQLVPHWSFPQCGHGCRPWSSTAMSVFKPRRAFEPFPLFGQLAVENPEQQSFLELSSMQWYCT